MGSSSTSINTAVDNRLAVTDQAFGLSSSGTANNTALRGNIFNISQGGAGAAKGAPGGSGEGINLNVLDGGVIDRAFDFASTSLSAVLDSLISGQKTQAAAAATSNDSVLPAVALTAQQQAGTIDAAATGQKKIVIALVAAGVIWYVWKGRK